MNKKIAVLMLGILFFLPIAGNAQGVWGGQSTANLYVGVGSALGKSGMEIDGQNLSWGNVGGELGLSYLYFASPYLALGADIHYAGFAGTQTVEDVPGWWHWHTLETDFETNTLHVMGIGRLTINPDSPVRLYLPFGAGVAFSEGKMRYKWDDHEYYSAESYDTSLSWYAGVGLEFETGNNWAWSIEARYNSFSHDYDEMTDYMNGHIVDTNPERNYVSLVINCRF